jgi:hypothetical protein
MGRDKKRVEMKRVYYGLLEAVAAISFFSFISHTWLSNGISLRYAGVVKMGLWQRYFVDLLQLKTSDKYPNRHYSLSVSAKHCNNLSFFPFYKNCQPFLQYPQLSSVIRLYLATLI